MKKYLLALLIIFTLSACKNTPKDADLTVEKTEKVSTDEITKETISDRHGDEIEIITNHTKDRITIHLNGKTYELKKNQSSTGFSTEDNRYLYTETKNEVTFLKKEMDMVLFHGKRNNIEKKIASQ